MILRAWVEAGGRLRVRVKRVTHDQAWEPLQGAVSTIDGACALVRTWLEGLLNYEDCSDAQPTPGDCHPGD